MLKSANNFVVYFFLYIFAARKKASDKKGCKYKMKLISQIMILLFKIGEGDEHLVALSDVWIHYNKCKLNIYIKDKKPYIKTELGFEYCINDLENVEKFSIYESLKKYENCIKEMLNESNNFDISY